MEMMAAPFWKEILPGVIRWSGYSPKHKVELTSHAVLLGGKIYCFDPIALAHDAVQRLTERGRPAAIILTSDNHERDALLWSEIWQVPVWASREAVLLLPGVRRFPLGAVDWNGWRLHQLEGGAGGELAFRAGSLVVMGDPIVNLPGHALELLPPKYCRSQGELRRSLAEVVREPFENLFVAHGDPVLGGASEKIAELLQSPRHG